LTTIKGSKIAVRGRPAPPRSPRLGLPELQPGLASSPDLRAEKLAPTRAHAESRVLEVRMVMRLFAWLLLLLLRGVGRRP
jgi:hypothetical protein